VDDRRDIRRGGGPDGDRERRGARISPWAHSMAAISHPAAVVRDRGGDAMGDECTGGLDRARGWPARAVASAAGIASRGARRDALIDGVSGGGACVDLFRLR